MVKKIISVFLVSTITCLAITNAVFACSPKEVSAFSSAHYVAVCEVLSVEQTPKPALKDEGICFIVTVKASEVLYGKIKKKKIHKIEMMLWDPKETPVFDKNKPYVLYLRNNDPSALEKGKVPLSVHYGMTSIQPDNKKLRKMLMPMIENRRIENKKPRRKVDIKSLSPFEKKMHKIILPEVEFRCANMIDVIGFFNMASIDYDVDEKDPAKKGVDFIFDEYSFPKDASMLLHYYLEGASLLSNIEIATALSKGERHVFENCVVIRKKGVGKPKSNISLGPQGKDTVAYLKLSSTIIPEVEFRNATCSDVAEHLSFKAGLKMTVDKSLDKKGETGIVTLNTRKLSTLSNLKIISALYNVEVHIDVNGVTIRPLPKSKRAK